MKNLRLIMIILHSGLILLVMYAFVYEQNPEWIVYDTTNSGLPNNWVSSLCIDPNGNRWIGSAGSGLGYFHDATWTLYNSSNSGLPADAITTIYVDESHNKWIGTNDGLAKLDSSIWTVYNTSNSGLQWCSL